VSDKLAIVTGGSAGIGERLVERLAKAGYAVAFSYRGDAAAAEGLARRVSASGGRALARACDVGMKAEVDDFVQAAADWASQAPQVLVNNAGVQTWAPLLDLEEARWDDVIRTNLKGCFLNTQAAARLMKAAGRDGAIVNIGSGCNKLAFPNLVDYTASKGGIEQFTKSAAVELGPFGITVNCVAPGAIITDRTAGESADYGARWSQLTPLGRVGTPDDVADVVQFFAGPQARFVTGQTIWVDGGLFSRAPWIAG
jgi:3-oxoacyl-[acyl-carrier protein] reductase